MIGILGKSLRPSFSAVAVAVVVVVVVVVVVPANRT